MQTPQNRSIGPLHIAFSHVSRSWLPLSNEASLAIQDHISHDRFKSDEQLLRRSLKSDLALFTHCVRQSIITTDEKPVNHWPLETLLNIKREVLENFVCKAPQQLEFHQAKHGTVSQRHLLSQPLVASVFSEALAPKMHIEAGKAFSCGIMRQLGLALVAWNYPGTFNGIVKNPAVDPIDRTLERKLGFSPMLLGITIAREWKLSTDLRSGMGEHFEVPSALGLSLRKLCRIGEVLARANEPFYTPEGSVLAKEAADQVTTLMGPHGLRILREKIGDEYPHLLSSLPDLFSVTQVQSASVAKEPPPQILLPLVEAIRKVSTANVTDERAMEALQKDIFKHSGFVSGCVYLLNPSDRLFTPRFALGTETLQLDPLPYEGTVATMKANRTPVFSSLRTPDQDQNPSFDTIYGILGAALPAGVLVLRPGPLILESDASAQRIIAHKAFELLRAFIEQSLRW